MHIPAEISELLVELESIEKLDSNEDDDFEEADGSQDDDDDDLSNYEQEHDGRMGR